ncbi:AraC family transcriptional regulator [Lentisphaera marina]|uniref:AraC family transcriptional regulator n=1 Tax=Lentisphaera marina TaxID=1111041 RepID=UPI00236630A0|nr:AraC family transcriptional regulator [Lentisphaera marina]MDD7984895.1 AraC family transcriptional regulator [Lentisphaera marina]
MARQTSDIENCVLSQSFLSLFEDIKNVLFFVKDKEGALVHGNLRLAKHMGFSHPDEIIGKTDFDIFPVEMAQGFRNDDAMVLESGEEKKSIIELFPNYLGDPSWFSTHKIPLFDRKGKVWGLCGILQRYEDSLKLMRPFDDIQSAVDYINDHFKEKISNIELAQMTGMSVRQFERRFKNVFSTTPHKYAIKLRIFKACESLINKNVTIAELALELGFYDQSAFSNTFKKHVGLSPLQYVSKNRK